MSFQSSARGCELPPLFTALVVDDDPAVSATISHALRQAGFDTTTLRQHHDVLREVEGRRFNLAFIDVKPPDAAGLELAATLKQGNLVGDCIVMAQGAPFDTVVRAVKLGAYDYLQKPFNPADLKLIISRVRERWELKQRVRRAELQHAALIQNIPLLIYALNRQLDLCFINKTVEEMLGFAPDDAMLAPRWLVERIHPQDRDMVVALFERSFETGQPISTQSRLLHRRGAVVHGIVRTIPYLEYDTHAGHIRRLDGIFVDLTDRIHLEQALVQSARLKTLGAISAEVAHEVRNPLMSIAGFARRLEKKSPDTPEVGIILRESRRLENLLNRIRDYLKPVPIHAREVSLNIVLADAHHHVAPEMEARRVWCAMDLDEQLPPAQADPKLLTQVVGDLLRGALQATPPGGTFHLRTYAAAGKVHLECRHPVDPERPLNPEMVLLPFDEGGFNEGLPTGHRVVTSMHGTMQMTQEGDEVVATVSLLPGGEEYDAGHSLAHAANGDAAEPGAQQRCFEEEAPVLAESVFEDLFARALRTGRARGEAVSVILLDLDHFEACLAHYGQAWAQQILAQVADAISDVLNRDPCAMVFRHGPQELAVILPNAGADAAMQTAEALRAAVADLRIPRGTPPDAVLTASLGVAVSLPETPLIQADMLAEAGKALFLAKQQGRNAVRCALS
ncbi:diguanylate cyclase domain-containing protein [Megalodesulfovibrio gigas]|uniref:histidine kinase n=1 Tax=Megalodesulfovibrio gigas (strain ATCC 19364 / DSM 1382 / NCIMB 9332 / VKM B-1759) TaxID=1121448 RepID=T2GF05_MEGG1|nr:diguanylate cyclase [Megalodesulfovibrio gigas]AGW14696.1 putative response regulator receiver modulated diguanylate cyclase [Megalodesulfovibrio gigas DSM 1382 = ATCC 19364]